MTNHANSSNHYFYNKRLLKNARKLRCDMTKAEACLWKYVLKSRKLLGFQFRRQRPVLHYIADFMCKELMLIIEVDGITHNDELVHLHDLKRQKDLENVGYTVLRFNDEDVLTDINGVYHFLEKWIEEYCFRIYQNTSNTNTPSIANTGEDSNS